MPTIRSVAVFCGASPGADPQFRAAARALGEGLARATIRLVYGGGRVGLMGTVADAALAAGGRVVGVIPEFLTRLEVAHEGVDEMIVTDSMHSRKQRMFELSDAFVCFAGGLGTLDETFEILTWKQLGLHRQADPDCRRGRQRAPGGGADRGGDRPRFRPPGHPRPVRGQLRRAGAAGASRHDASRAAAAGRRRPLVTLAPPGPRGYDARAGV